MSVSAWRAQLSCVLVALVVGPGAARADGFRNPPEGEWALGRIGGKVAQIDDASAVSHNPANLADLERSSFIASLTLGYSKKEYESPTGVEADSKDPWGYLPNLYAAWPIESKKVVAGIGLTTPFGRSTTYEKDSYFRYTAPYFAELRGINLNPTLAMRVKDNLTAGVGVDILYSDLDLRQFYPWSAATGNPAAPDGVTKFDADGVGLGGNAGVTWEFHERQRVAVTYRMPIHVYYEGDFEVSDIPAGVPADPRSSFETDIEFPAVLAFGYGVELNDEVRVEADVEWVQHSLFSSLPLDVANNQALLPADELEANWEDTWTFGLGGDWKFAPNWVARAGYIYLPSPVTDETLTPTVAEEDQSVVSVGLGYENNGRRVD
ncbi:MAG TPA: outer membrane protein transport protein, partial [Kiritimatiellia bacterium]